LVVSLGDGLHFDAVCAGTVELRNFKVKLNSLKKTENLISLTIKKLFGAGILSHTIIEN
jgi:hypothetical protein